MNKIIDVTDESFESEVLESNTPVLVDFWATWCKPCQMLAPIVAEISDDYADKLKVCKMDVDQNTNIPAKFGIRGIPTIIIYKEGQAVATKSGNMSKSQMKAFVDSVI